LVNLLKNEIGIEQAQALASVLKMHSTLKSLCGNKGGEIELDMRGKMSGAGDAIMLAAEVADNKALTSLNLASNQLSRGALIPERANWIPIDRDDRFQTDMSGVVAVTGAFKDIGAITKLDMSVNYFKGAAAGKAIGDMLTGNSTLKDLHLSSCYIDASAAQEMSTSLAGNEALSKLDLRSNALPVQSRQEIWTLCKSRGISLEIEKDGLVEEEDDSSSQEEAKVETLVIGGITVESTMTEADFSGKDLEEAEVVALAAFLPGCR
jgi:hypothetical protein